MFLVVTGNVNPEEIIELVRNNQENKTFEITDSALRIKKYKEPVTVYKEFEKIQMPVSIPKICIGIKIDISQFSEEEKQKLSYYLNFAFWVNFGATSDFKEEMIQSGILTRGINYSKERVEDFFFINCMVDTPRYEELLQHFYHKLDHLTLSEDELKRMKRVMISDYIFQSDDLYDMNQQIIYDYLDYGKVKEDPLSEIRALNQQEFYQYMRKLNFQHRSVVVIEPLK